MLELHGVHKSFGTLEVLRGIDLTVHKGGVVCVIGPSGSGKSTLLRCINLLEPPDEGKIVLEGKEITGRARADDLDYVRRRVGMVFQQFNLFPHKSALDNVRLAQEKVLGRSREEATEKAHDLLGRVGLSDKADEYPDRLSGGQQQRVAIARALVSRPTVVFADEPTGNLDSKTGGEILELLHDSVESYGQTMVMVTHESRAAATADRILFLADGEIVRDLGGADEDTILDTIREVTLA
ncbi:MAG: amino acid ABC transporter ATP-binding protein [Gaiellaceae bacterium]